MHRRRMRAWRAALLVVGQAVRSALAGAGLPIAPLLWGGLLGLVLLAGLVVLIVLSAGGHQAGGHAPATRDLSTAGAVEPGGLVGPDGGRIGWLPLGPGAGDDGPDEPGPSPRGASLELRLGPSTDLRHLRYTLTYHPLHPDDPREIMYLHHARLDSRKLELVPAHQVSSDPLRYRWPQADQARLCFSGIAFDREHPSCEGVVRISSQQQGVRATLARLAMLATPRPPLGQPGEREAVELQATTISAHKWLALRDVFFVSMLRVGHDDSRLYLVERDEAGGGYRAQLLPDTAHASIDSRYYELELARDGSRLYLSSSDERSVFEWRGQRSGPLPIAEFPWWDGRLLGGMTATDSGLCIVEMKHADTAPATAALRCLRQSSGVWGAARPLASTLVGQGQTEPPAYAMASLGDSVLAVLRQRRQSVALSASYVRDAWVGEGPTQAVTLQNAAPGPERLVQGALALAGQGGHQEYVLFGKFPLQAGQAMAFAPIAADAAGTGAAYLSAWAPFSPYGPWNSSIDRGVAWFDPASRTARILIFQSDRLRSVYYDMLRRRPIAEQAVDPPAGWRLRGAFNLLELDSRPTQLVVAGRTLRTGDSVALLVYRLPGFGLPAQFQNEVRLLDAADPGVRDLFINAITRNVLWLTPAEPED